ncbi:hypothetical protein Tco_0588282 [Tanacetum coccineum]
MTSWTLHHVSEFSKFPKPKSSLDILIVGDYLVCAFSNSYPHFMSCFACINSDIVKIVSTAVRSGTAGEFSVAGTAGIVTVVSWYGPSKMFSSRESPFDLVSMYLKKRDCY